LPTFSQTVTNKQDTLVPVPLSQLRKAMYEVQMYDVCKREVVIQDSVIQTQNIKISLQASVIETNNQIDSVRVSQMQDLRHISTLKDTKIKLLTKENTKQKKITVGVGILGILGIIFL
jgi:uncharacterized protein YlxW (UPF0749 family)